MCTGFVKKESLICRLSLIVYNIHVFFYNNLYSTLIEIIIEISTKSIFNPSLIVQQLLATEIGKFHWKFNPYRLTSSHQQIGIEISIQIWNWTWKIIKTGIKRKRDSTTEEIWKEMYEDMPILVDNLCMQCMYWYYLYICSWFLNHLLHILQLYFKIVNWINFCTVESALITVINSFPHNCLGFIPCNVYSRGLCTVKGSRLWKIK
jgi:hypothetical protein